MMTCYGPTRSRDAEVTYHVLAWLDGRLYTIIKRFRRLPCSLFGMNTRSRS